MSGELLRRLRLRAPTLPVPEGSPRTHDTPPSAPWFSPDGALATIGYIEALHHGHAALLEVRSVTDRQRQAAPPVQRLAALADAALALAMHSREASETIALHFDPRRLPAGDALLAALVGDHARLACDLDTRLAAVLLEAATPGLAGASG